MAIFAVISLLPSLVQPTYTYVSRQLLPATLLALGISGPLAPILSKTLGPQLTFVGLLFLRGTLLIASAYKQSLLLYTATLCTILFGHGIGFGVIPALIRKRTLSAQSFSHHCGKVLTAWGVAGILGCWLNAYLVIETEDIRRVFYILGIITFSAGCFLSFVIVLGRQLVFQLLS